MEEQGDRSAPEGSAADRRLLAEPVVAELRALDELWVELAGRCGFRIVRSLDAWVAYDGRDGIHVAAPEELDEDDCLAQILLHELCHWLMEGEASRAAHDWGLCNEDGRDLAREHAALALQRVCTRAHGLEEIFAPTTEHWRVWRALPGWDAKAEEAMLGRWRAHAAGAEVPHESSAPAAHSFEPDTAETTPAPLPSTAVPSTAVQSTAVPSTAVQSTAVQSTAVQSTAVQSTAVQSTARPSLAPEVAAAIERAARLGVLAAIDHTLRATAQRLVLAAPTSI